jgi:hypothetical protein
MIAALCFADGLVCIFNTTTDKVLKNTTVSIPVHSGFAMSNYGDTDLVICGGTDNTFHDFAQC